MSVMRGFVNPGPMLHPANKDKLREMLAQAAAATAKIPLRSEQPRKPDAKRRKR